MQLKRTLIFTIIFSFIFNLFIVFPVRADTWGANIGAARFLNLTEQIQQAIRDAIRGALKQAAAEMMHTLVSNMISGGGSGEAKFITNWENYLYNDPRKKTDVIMNDIFTVMYGGRGSSSNYQAVGAEGVMGNYNSYLAQAVRQATTGSTIPRADYQNYISDPRQMSNLGGAQFWRAYSATIISGNPANTPLPAIAIASLMDMSVYQQQQDVARTPSIAYQGFRSQEKNGQVVTPGSTLKDIQSQVEDLGNKILANANSVPEIIVAVVTKLVTKTIRQGIGNVQRQVQKEITNTTSGVRQNINQAIQSSGPGTVFKPKY